MTPMRLLVVGVTLVSVLSLSAASSLCVSSSSSCGMGCAGQPADHCCCSVDPQSSSSQKDRAAPETPVVVPKFSLTAFHLRVFAGACFVLQTEFSALMPVLLAERGGLAFLRVFLI